MRTAEERCADLRARGKGWEYIRRLALARNDTALLNFCDAENRKEMESMTKALTKHEEQLTLLDPGTMRHEALSRLISFRRNWVSLGEILDDIARGGDYRDWGYKDFESYCARELGLKKPTVKKLIVSYRYMKTNEPTRLQDGSDVPDYRTIAVLSEAEQNDAVDPEQLREVKAEVFDGELDDATGRALRKRLAEMKEAAPLPLDTRRAEIMDVIKEARKLRRKLTHSTAVPDGIRERAERILDEIEGMDA